MPSELVSASWRAIRRMVRDDFTGTAAELAYYGLLSAVPCIAVFIGIIGIVGSNPDTSRAIVEIVSDGGSSATGASVARDVARDVVDDNAAGGVALGVGTVTTLWTGSLYLTAFRQAAYRVHGADPGAVWRARPLHLVLMSLGLVTLAVVALGVLATQRIMEEIGEAIGAEDLLVAIWSFARWPLILAIGLLIIVALFGLAPRVEGERRRVITAGALTAVLVWMLASLGFDVWASSFASYDATYGVLAGAVAFAIWLWISNLALLFGLMLDLELGANARTPAG